MDPRGRFAAALARARRQLLLARAIESAPLALAGVALAAAASGAIGRGGLLAAGVAALAGCAAAAAAGRSARRVDERLGLGGRASTAAECAGSASLAPVPLLLVLDAARVLERSRRPAPAPPRAGHRAAVVAAGALVALADGAAIGLRMAEFPALALVPAPAVAAAPTRPPPRRADQAAPVPPEPGADAQPADAGAASRRTEEPATPSVEPDAAGPGQRTPKAVPIEPDAGASVVKDARIFEFVAPAAGAGHGRRVPLAEALPEARGKAAAFVKEGRLAPEEGAFVGRYFERLGR